ncbi:MAG: hypothetical protein VKN60_11155 [Cyanobacteriota bacterium]|nr:hypothetical protein [Cyanobacteriota bacterium]
MLTVFVRWLGIGCLLLLTLGACQPVSAPLEFAPDGPVVRAALTYQLQETQRRLSEQLEIPAPEVELSDIRVETLEPILIQKLAAYHLRGRYDVSLTLPGQHKKQKNNRFEIYLQRQEEGKSWRLLQREVLADQTTQWYSELIETPLPPEAPSSSS